MNSIRNTILKVNILKLRANHIKSPAMTNLSCFQFHSFAALPHVPAKTNGILQKLHYTRFYKFRQAHNQGQNDLVDYLSRINKKTAKVIPTKIDEFEIKLDDAEVTLTKKLDKETIRIKFNVAHSLDTDPEIPIYQYWENAVLGEFITRSDFTVEIIRQDSTFCLNCSFVYDYRHAGKDRYVYTIKNISIYDKEWKPNSYSVSNQVLDKVFNDHLLNYLKEKGITKLFACKTRNCSTTYEHLAFISIVEGLRTFVSKK